MSGSLGFSPQRKQTKVLLLLVQSPFTGPVGAGSGSPCLDITCIQMPSWRLAGGHRCTG